MCALVMCDIGNVLVRIDHERFYKQLSLLSGLSSDEAKRRLANTGFDLAFDRGRVDTFRWTIRRALKLDNTFPDTFLDEAYLDVLVAPNRPVIDLKRRLMASGVAVGLLSNSHRMARERIQKRWPGTLDANARSLYSDELGALKPEGDIYGPLRKHHAIFIDDVPENFVYPATVLGWECIHYGEFSPAPVPASLAGHARYHEARNGSELATLVRELL